MNHSLIIDEVLAHPQDVSWLPWAVQYFFFIGIAACAALFACVLHWRKKETADLENLTLLIALTCAITAPLALTADLHQTARVWHFYAYPTPWSWMPWGALFLPLSICSPVTMQQRNIGHAVDLRVMNKESQ